MDLSPNYKLMLGIIANTVDNIFCIVDHAIHDFGICYKSCAYKPVDTKVN